MLKRIGHYIVLSAVLLGIPLVCCFVGGYDSVLEGVKAFPPRTEDWGLHPQLLWNHRCPFNGWVFATMAVFTIGTTWPFVLRAIRAAWRARGKEPGVRFPFPWWGWLGLVILTAGWTLSWTRFEWFRPYQVMCSYFPIWIGFILVMNGLCQRRRGGSPLTDHPLPYLATFPASALFWWFFEYLNRYVWNWYYLGVADLGAAEYVIYATLCFTSVLPGVTAVADWLRTFPAFADDVYDGMWKVELRSAGGIVFFLVVAAIGLTGIVFVPNYVYPFLWMSPLAMFVLVQYLFRESCVTDRLRTGNWSFYFRFSVAALICGLCWETWNYYAYAKWVYAVPYVHRFQIWEMPLIGFAGYLPFGVECAAVTAWICPALVFGDLWYNKRS